MTYITKRYGTRVKAGKGIYKPNLTSIYVIPEQVPIALKRKY